MYHKLKTKKINNLKVGNTILLLKLNPIGYLGISKKVL